jgi:hypothetical protein
MHRDRSALSALTPAPHTNVYNGLSKLTASSTALSHSQLLALALLQSTVESVGGRKSMLAARLQLRRRCIRCCSCSFSSEQAARRSSSESANPQQHADSAERDNRSQLQSSSSEHGHNSTLPTLEEQAEMNFEILAVMSKSNARFSTRQHIADESEEEEEQNDKKHLAPQHRRFLSHPQIGAGMTANKAPT